jgi:hypothetical protein
MPDSASAGGAPDSAPCGPFVLVIGMAVEASAARGSPIRHETLYSAAILDVKTTMPNVQGHRRAVRDAMPEKLEPRA